MVDKENRIKLYKLVEEGNVEGYRNLVKTYNRLPTDTFPKNLYGKIEKDEFLCGILQEIS